MLRSADKALQLGKPLSNVLGEAEDFPLLLDERHNGAISTLGPWSLGGAIYGTRGGLATVANRAIFVPFRLPVPVTVYQLACGTGTGTTGNFDIGVYDSLGNLLVSTGSTAKTTASSERIVDVTDTKIRPGLYYLALVTDSSANYLQNSSATVAICKLCGLRQMDTAFPLPSTASFATIGTAQMPFLAAYIRAD